MSDVKWSEWKDYDAQSCPVPSNALVQVKLKGDSEDRRTEPQLAIYWSWINIGCDGDIIAYRYQITDQPEVTEAEEEEWQRMDEEQSRQQYSAYYKDVRHIEYIDVYRTVDLFGCEKHGHPISHAAKKLLLTGARTGGKDVETEVREAIDSLYRWLEMREEDKKAQS